MTGADRDEETERVGLVIDGRYRITGVLGRGGMGSVYRAEHLRLRRPVAVKLLHPGLGAIREIGQRFEREAFAAGKLDHPNCVGVSDFGELDDGSLYLVMELIEGESLAEVLEREAPLPVNRALHIMRHVLRGLTCAHAAGIIHRDIKPDNVALVERDGDRDFARILDFGIAKLTGETAAEEGGPKLTQTGIAFGTPLYLAPEQATGGTIDHRADLYGASVLCFEMIAGRPPFVAEEKLDVLMMHVTRPVPAFRDVAPHLRIAPEVEALVRRGLAKDPADRYASADEYCAALERCLAPEVAASPSAAPAGSLAYAPTGRAATPAMPAPVSARVTSPPVVTGSGAVLGTVRRSPIHTGATELSPGGGRILRRVAIGAAAFVVLLVIAAAVGSGDDEDDARPSGDTAMPALSLPSLPGSGDAELAQYLALLEQGRRCEDRREAIGGLVALGDKRAIPALRKARNRNYRGGFLGLETRNANRCLKKETDAAIEYLEKP